MTAQATRDYRIALVGNPNCGKTALFNALTGSRQKIANYPGVTVERKEGNVRTPTGRVVRIVDLPGTYSLRARSPDEEVTRDIVLGRYAGETDPDAIVCVADATNLRLALRLVLELKQVGKPIVLALNMMDIARRRGIDFDLDALRRELGVAVVPSTAIRNGEISALVDEIDRLATVAPETNPHTWRAPGADDLRAAHREADRIIAQCVKPATRPDVWTARLDAILLHPVYGIVILLAVLFLIFQAVFAGATPAMDAIAAGFGWFADVVKNVLPDGLLRSLITDGIISGVGSVLVFLPQILILFFFINLLEDLGYMARAAFLMDRVMGGAGLHGRAFIPLLSSFACAIPGIMAARVIESPRDRLATILVAPLMTCSARIPVYTLIISAFVPRQTFAGLVNLQGLVMFGLYAAGILSALVVAFVLRRLIWRSGIEPFIMELPDYKLPYFRNILIGVGIRAKMFLVRAGTIILSMMILIWFLSSVPSPPAGAPGPAIDYSFAGMIGHALQPLLAPIGFNWQIAVALIPGLAAREVAVAALGAIYAIGGGEASSGALIQTLASDWTLPTALSMLAWYVFAPQCVATLGIVRRETNSWQWPVIMFIYMMTLAYLASFAVFHTARLVLG